MYRMHLFCNSLSRNVVNNDFFVVLHAVNIFFKSIETYFKNIVHFSYILDNLEKIYGKWIFFSF